MKSTSTFLAKALRPKVSSVNNYTEIETNYTTRAIAFVCYVVLEHFWTEWPYMYVRKVIKEVKNITPLLLGRWGAFSSGEVSML